MKIKIFFFVFLLYCVNYAAQQEKMMFRNLTPEMGLSHGDVLCIYQDHEDYIWIGTADGLNKYDGYKFTVYKNNPDDPWSLSHNNISTLLDTEIYGKQII